MDFRYAMIVLVITVWWGGGQFVIGTSFKIIMFIYLFLICFALLQKCKHASLPVKVRFLALCVNSGSPARISVAMQLRCRLVRKVENKINKQADEQSSPIQREERYREREREREREIEIVNDIDIPRDRQTNRHTCRQTNIPTDIHTD